MSHPDIPHNEKPGIEPGEPMDSSGRKIFLYYLSRVVKHEKTVRDSDNPDGVHDMRVAIRRLRSALSIFEDSFKRRAIKAFRKDFRDIASALGTARDLHVTLAAAKAYASGLDKEEQDTLQGLLDSWRTELDATREKLLSTLNSSAYEKLIDQFATFVTTPDVDSKTPDTDEPEPYLVRHVVPILIVQRNSAMRAYERVFEGENLDTLHRLRIAAKKFRYTIEAFQEVLGPEAKKVVDVVKSLQDDLGAVQDTRITASKIMEYAATATQDRAAAALAYLRSREDQKPQLIAVARTTWHRFNERSTQRALYKALEALL